MTAMSNSTATGLISHPDAALAARLTISRVATGSEVMSDPEFFSWLEQRRHEHVQRVRRIPFDQLNGWSFDPDTGDLGHRSGRFYSVQGLSVRSASGPVRSWTQPIISQPEIGILGIAVREINGVLHCLMQAKAEPGNINGVQLSPTVQATKSNYTQVHGGSAVPYLDCFRSADPGQVLADVLQSEQGAWFYCKRNRNMVVEVGPEVEAGEDFCWLTLRQLNDLLGYENLLNMDARTVLSCVPHWQPEPQHGELSLHSGVQIRSWITAQQSEQVVRAKPLPLRAVEGQGWHRTATAIAHDEGRYFSIVAVDVDSHRREVTAWSQPLLEPHGLGVAALLVKSIGGVLHSLVHAQVEPGFLDLVELGPTVQCTPNSYAHLPEPDRPTYLDLVLAADPDKIRYDTILSEEGGRFLYAQTRYLIIEVDEDFPIEAPDEFRWMSLRQLTEFLKYSHYLNVQARTMVAALRTLPQPGGAHADHR